MVTATIALVVLAGIVTAAVLVVALGQGTQQANASPVITPNAAARDALAPLPVPSTTPRPMTSGKPRATHSPVTTDTTAASAVTPQSVTGTTTAPQDSDSPPPQQADPPMPGARARGQQFGSFNPFGFGFGRGGNRLGGLAGPRRLPG